MPVWRKALVRIRHHSPRRHRVGADVAVVQERAAAGHQAQPGHPAENRVDREHPDVGADEDPGDERRIGGVGAA